MQGPENLHLNIPLFSQEKSSDQKQQNVYKDYLIQQNLVFMEDNKKLEKYNQEYETKIEEMEDEMDTTESRLRKIKIYLNNFHSINNILKEVVENLKENIQRLW